MTDVTVIHPDTVFEALLAKGGRSNRQTTLTKLHELCQRRYDTSERDFSIPAIGKQMEAANLMRGRALYNRQSSDYRELITAWGRYAGPASLPKPPKPLASAEYLTRIDDPAIRSLMQSIVSERDKLKAQLNLLKANTLVTVDRRPPSRLAGAGGSQELLPAHESLTPSEREALVKSVSADFLDARSLEEGSHGEILNRQGRVIFEVGFTKAIRKLLRV